MTSLAKIPAADTETLLDLKALAHPLRFRLLHLLTEPRYAGELAPLMGITPQAVVHHVEQLKEREFVQTLNGRRVRGPVVEWQVRPERLVALSTAIARLGRIEPTGGPMVRIRNVTVPLNDEASMDPVRPSSGYLLVLNGPAEGTRLILEPALDEWTIGRESTNDLCLRSDPFASGSHALLARRGGMIEVTDLRSANGTFLNLARIPSGGQVTLCQGDVLRCGQTLIVYHSA